MFNNKFYGRVKNSANLLIDRQYGRNLDAIVCKRLQSASQFVDRLELEASLPGHDGCVNCLEWSSDGRILASGSDDFHVMLWDPFRRKRLLNLETPHTGNMFSVKFLPKSANALIATGAADKRVHVFDVNRQNTPIWQCGCHVGRVKRLATAPDMPYVFWSGSEDGSVFQFDIREPHSVKDKVVVVQLRPNKDTIMEVKCIAVNPLRNEYIAVGANDAYARVYDRRMLKLRTLIDGEESVGQMGKECATYYCPGHISRNPNYGRHSSKAITYLTYNAYGTELLVNIGGEHIYLYDLTSAEKPVFLDLPAFARSSASSSSSEQVDHTVEPPPHSHGKRKLPANVEGYKKMGNEFLENEKYLRAIDQYSEAIAIAPDCPIFYLNRATAYMRRLWYGDVYAALRDCQSALRIDPSYVKAHFRLARALLDLGCAKEAEDCLKELINRFPSYANNHGVMMLRKDIEAPKKSGASNHRGDVNGGGGYCLNLSTAELNWRLDAKDYKDRFVGHCNTTTDIKEANYFGSDGEFIVAGSDDENFFIWERATQKIRSVYRADEAIVNCVQPHPTKCLMATSGIDRDIKIWSPAAVVDEDKSNRVSYIDSVVESNQHKMTTEGHEITGPYCVSS